MCVYNYKYKLPLHFFFTFFEYESKLFRYYLLKNINFIDLISIKFTINVYTLI